MPTEIFRVEASEDDGSAEAGVWNYTSGELPVGEEPLEVILSAAYRFRSVTIPKEAYIHSARLITSDVVRGRNVGNQLTTLVGIKEPNTKPFTDNPLGRPETVAFVYWDNYRDFGEGVTTHDGKTDGSTVIDTTRPENDEFWRDGYIAIPRFTPGAPRRKVIEWIKKTGTFIVEPFDEQILAGTEYEVNATYSRSPNLASIIQEIIGQPEWKSGNPIALKHLGDRSHRAWAAVQSYDAMGAFVPSLEITWEILTYRLTINTTPISGVEFTLDSLKEVTPFSSDVSPGTYIITMPELVTVNGQDYWFAGWADGVPDRIRTIDLTADTTLTANYELAPVTHTVNVESTPVTGVPVTVDDASVGNTPVSVSVIEGDHSFRVPEEVEV